MIRSLVVLMVLLPRLVIADAELSYADSRSEASTIQVLGDRVLLTSGDSAVLYRKGREELTMIEHRRRSYVVFDKAATARMGQQRAQMQSQMSQMMAQMQRQLQSMPPEQRKRMERIMHRRMGSSGGAGGAQQTLRRGTNATVGRWSCQEVTVLEGGAVKQVHCVAAPKTLGLSTGEYDALLGAMSAMRSLARTAAGHAPGMVADFRTLGGVPVRTKDVGSGRTTTLRSVSRRKLSPAAFEVPAGYKREKLFQ